MYGRANQMFIVAFKIFFLVFGVLGNFCFILLVVKHPKLRSKSALLQAAQCFSHIICLIESQVDTFLIIQNIQLPRVKCYPLISGYVFFEAVQTMIMLMLVLDILLMVKAPMSYKTISTTKYMVLMIVPAVLYGLVFFVWGFIGLDEEIIIFCNPPLGLHSEASNWFGGTGFLLNVLTLMVFLVLIRIFHSKGKTRNENSMRAMRRLKVSVVIFLCSWFTSQAVASFFHAFGLPNETLSYLLSNVGFFILLTFSQSFYVIIWRSQEYRRHFFALLNPKFGSAQGSNAVRSTNNGNTSKIMIMTNRHSNAHFH